MVRMKELVAGARIHRGDKLTVLEVLQSDPELFRVSVGPMPWGSRAGPLGRADQSYDVGDLILSEPCPPPPEDCIPGLMGVEATRFVPHPTRNLFPGLIRGNP